MNATDGPLSLRAIRRYVLEMAAGLGQRQRDVELHLVFFTHRLGRVRRFLRQLPADANAHRHVIPLPRRWCYRRYEQGRAELRRLAAGMDLYHETTTDNPAFDDLPVLTTIHGLCPLVRPDILDPDFAQEKGAWFTRAITNSDCFTPVSETSRQEFLERFEVPESKVRAIPLGVSRHFHCKDAAEVAAETRAYFGWSTPYVLYVGGIQPNKNIGIVLRTFGELVRRDKFEGELVLAGDLHYPLSEFRHLVECEGIANRVRLTGCLPPEDPRLAALYRGASLFLFPSLYEGWTSPPLEAMACGTPVIASAASSIPETVGDGGLTADPHDLDAWVAAASNVLGDPDLGTRLREAGLARAAEFPWSRTVDDTLTFYRDIVEGKIATTPALREKTPVPA